jgi:hypothetical protein
LARTGLQAIYDRYGAEGVMMRLRTWLRDAMTGGLMIDGWEPVPFSARMLLRGGLLDAAVLQEIAAKRRDTFGWTTGVAKVTTPDHGDYVVLDATEISSERPAYNSNLSKAADALREGSQRIGVPWVFVWPADDVPIAEPVFGLWSTYSDMLGALRPVGLADPLQDAIGRVLGNGCDCKHAPGRRSIVVLIGLWRPTALAKNIFGLSSDPIARRLEIKAFTVEAGSVNGNLLADDAKLRAIVADPLPSPTLFRWVSGVPALNPVGIIGHGALGCSIADHLLRSGIEEINGIDRENMLPHNIARHDAEIVDIYKPKIDHLARAADAVAAAALKPRIRVFKENAAELSHGALADRLGGSSLIIDATADERVRGRLTEFNKHDRRQIVRVEIYHRGRLGVQFVTSASGNPSLLDLYYLLCSQALTDNAVAHWLLDEHVAGADADELLFGFGCASRTLRLPNYVVAQHASAFMPMIVQGLAADAPPGIGLNSLDKDFRPMGWRWIEAAAFGEFDPGPAAPGWTVRVHRDVLAFLDAQRATALPAETGGYLYGGFDLSLKQIVVIAASPLPPGSVAAETSLVLGPAGQTATERRLARRTRGRIGLCGTWHSHPGSSAAMSDRDWATITGLAAADRECGIPTLLVVVAEHGAEVHLTV